jgi:hypothetical protein
MGIRKNDKHQLFTHTCKNQTTSWLMHNLSVFGVRTNHRQTRTHKTHHGPDLKEATTFPLILYFVLGHGTITQMAFCLRTPKRESRNSQSLQLWGHITLCADLRLRWGLKQSYNPHQWIYNGMLHTTYTQGNWGDSRLLVVGSQIVNLTPGLFFWP